jgi:uncharacterized protein
LTIISIFENLSTGALTLLVFSAFFSGFIDAIAGGGGLVQLPALLISFPESPLPSIFGTNKIAALAGTTTAAVQYSKRIKFDIGLLITISIFAFLFARLGASSVKYIHVEIFRPVILVILIAIAMYTYFKKDLGQTKSKDIPIRSQYIFGSVLGSVVGFYDGFFGPGTGNFLVFGFVIVLGFEFIKASAYSKVINCITNISALIVFLSHGNYYLYIGLLMAVFNITGSFIGSHLALRKGNSFIRLIFFIVVIIMIARYAYDIFLK